MAFHYSGLTGLHYKKANHSTVSQEAYVYDDAGNLTSKTVDSVTTDYTYDDIDQMLSEVKSGYSASYTYDGNGNRATRTLNGTTQNYTYDDADKLTEIKVGGTTVKSFGYDAAGRTTGITYSGATTTLAYDYEGRVTSITRSGSTTNSFTYNGLNARMTRSDSNGSRTMLRDGADVLAPVVKDGSKEYAAGLYQWDSTNGSKPFVTDRLGSVTKITDWQGNSPASKSFDAFGVQQSGSTSDLFGFAGAWGYQSDADHGLQLLGHRVYDPDLGRFLTRDPIKDGRNWYGYCENNPTRFVDPEGLGIYEWIYTGDWNASDDVYEAALIAASTQLVGRDETDPEGYPVKIGGPVNWINPRGNAVTPNGVTFINPEDEWSYWNSQWWRAHEHRHVHQRLEIAADLVGSGAHNGPMPDWKKTAFFLIAIVQEYAESGSHDGSGLERDADRWADYAVGRWGR